MALINFPYQIRVVLGGQWNGGGNGLNNGTELILTRTDPASDNRWSEDGTKIANNTSNRLRLYFPYVGGVRGPDVHVANGTGTYAWQYSGYIYASNPTSFDYNFLSVFNVNSTNRVSPLADKYRITIHGNNSSVSGYGPTSFTTGQYGTFQSAYASYFSIMEEHIDPSSSSDSTSSQSESSSSSTDPSPVDKTTYVFE